MDKRDMAAAFEALCQTPSTDVYESTATFIKTFAKQNRRQTIEYLMAYVERIDVHKNIIVKWISDLVRQGENQYADFFYRAMRQGLAYGAAEGLMKADGAQAYPFLVDFIKSDSPIEERGQAVIMLAKYSGQAFDYDLPNDPAYWPHIPVQKILQWQSEGYLKQIPPPEPPCRTVICPQTAMDWVVQKLEDRLLKERKRWRTGSREYNRTLLVAPDRHTIETIRQTWQLPAIYLTFLQKHSPKTAIYLKGIRLYGAAALLDAQTAYARQPSGEQLDGWDTNWVVIADKDADPYIIKLTHDTNGDTPVYKATHGQGVWRFKQTHTGFMDFLQKLAGIKQPKE